MQPCHDGQEHAAAQLVDRDQWLWCMVHTEVGMIHLLLQGDIKIVTDTAAGQLQGFNLAVSSHLLVICCFEFRKEAVARCQPHGKP